MFSLKEAPSNDQLPCFQANVTCGHSWTAMRTLIVPPGFFVIASSVDGAVVGGIRYSFIWKSQAAAKDFSACSDSEFKHRAAVLGLMQL